MSSNSLVPANGPPHATGDAGGSHTDRTWDRADHGGQRRTAQAPLLSADDCRRMLAQQIKFTTTKLISPAQANANTRILQTLLADARASEMAGPAPVVGDNVIQILRDSPDLLEFVEPLLTREQLAKILGAADENA